MGKQNSVCTPARRKHRLYSTASNTAHEKGCYKPTRQEDKARMMGPFLSCGELPGTQVLLLRKCIMSYTNGSSSSFKKKKKVYVYGCSACIYVCACVCLVPIASKARRSCTPLAGSRTHSTEAVGPLLLHHSLPFLNASQT